MSQILMTWGAYKKDKKDATDIILERSRNRQMFYEKCVMMITTAQVRGLRLIMENPWGHHSYLNRDFICSPAFVDKDRSLRGDWFGKPTAYWFINCEPTIGFSYQPRRKMLVKKDVPSAKASGLCNSERSSIHPDYARNFICDFIIGKKQQHTQLTLF